MAAPRCAMHFCSRVLRLELLPVCGAHPACSSFTSSLSLGCFQMPAACRVTSSTARHAWTTLAASCWAFGTTPTAAGTAAGWLHHRWAAGGRWVAPAAAQVSLCCCHGSFEVWLSCSCSRAGPLYVIAPCWQRHPVAVPARQPPTPCLQAPRCRDGSIAAYVAKHGHGVYPSAGRVYRHFCLGNDLCCSGGPVWRPRRVVLLPPLEHANLADSPAAVSELF